MRSKIFSILTLLTAVSFSSDAKAVPVSCISALGLPCIAVKDDVLADGVVVPNSGNDFENIVEAAIKIATGVAVDLTLFGKSDTNAALFSFSNFDEGASLTQSKAGDWSVLSGALISYITVKAANSFAVYQFGPSSSGTYSTEGILNNGGQRPDVSHISFWTAPQGNDVPEPATMALLASSLAGLGYLKRKKA